VLIPKGSDIKSPKDLEGKTIAANTLNNICEVTINATLEKQGVDVSKLKYTEIPFPDMVGALEKGRVDAACVVEPFVSQGKAAGMKGIDPFYAATAPDLTVATYFASKQMIESKPELIERFKKAMEKSLEVLAGAPGRGPRGAARVHADPQGGRGEDQPSELEAGADRGHDPDAVRAQREVRVDREAARPRPADPEVSL
jgi:ABC-type nitrate/sulfonate/bicarbonate transport system substrate-binding protein